MNGFTRAAAVGVLFSLFTVNAALASSRTNGTLTNLIYTNKFGTAPGLDQLDASGNYVLGSGHDGIHLPTDAVVVSLDGGHFIQALPSNSLTAISGGYRYLNSTASGITQLKIMNNGTFLLQIRKADFSLTKPTSYGAISITVGDDVFTAIPNSLPVSKIVSAQAATVGSPVTLDGTQSSDFNSDALTYAWTLISQPLGSSVSLTSGTNSTTSFTATKNGAYVIRLTVSDAAGEGVPTLVTLLASGGTEDPVTPPGPVNGLISLSTNQPSYLVGESAVLTMHEDAQPGNGTNRFFWRATLNDAPITLTPVPNSNDDTYTAPAFTEAGTQTFKVDLYIENINLAKALATAITGYNTDITAVNSALLYETDPDVIAKLQDQKAYDMEQIVIANDQLEANRTKVGETALLSFSVN